MRSCMFFVCAHADIMLDALMEEMVAHQAAAFMRGQHAQQAQQQATGAGQAQQQAQGTGAGQVAQQQQQAGGPGQLPVEAQEER